MDVKIEPGEVSGTIIAPPSKSMMQRAVALALLADGTTKISNPSFCDDSKAALEIAKALGAEVIVDGNTVQITGSKNLVSSSLDCGESGLCMRMFSPIAALFDKEITLTGKGSLMSRPVGMIEEPLRALDATCKTNNGKPPVVVRGPMKGGNITVDGSESSQFLTGLLIALPLCERDSMLSVKNLKSRPYVDMTLQIAREFGATIVEKDRAFNINGNQQYSARDCKIEGDWSGAAFLLVAGAIVGNGRLRVNGLNEDSAQADKAILTVLDKCNSKSGTLSSFEFDATNCPDLFPPLVALACSCIGTSRITGVDRLRHKESDRAAVLIEEFAKIGADIRINEKENALEVTGTKLKGGTVNSHGDHRIAMACSIAALNATNGVTIQNAECVSKSYNDFFDALRSLGANITEVKS